jgi:hypothetical protein
MTSQSFVKIFIVTLLMLVISANQDRVIAQETIDVGKNGLGCEETCDGCCL